jgi:hypothetical protein
VEPGSSVLCKSLLRLSGAVGYVRAWLLVMFDARRESVRRTDLFGGGEVSKYPQHHLVGRALVEDDLQSPPPLPVGLPVQRGSVHTLHARAGTGGQEAVHG